MADLLNGKKIGELDPATSIENGDEIPGIKASDPTKTYRFSWAVIKVAINAMITAAVAGIIKGDKGDTGAKGDQGIQGEKGIKGDKGDRGDQGLKGDVGSKGDQGIQGAKGDKGDKGDTGAQGVQGIKGDKGDQGDPGADGIDGVGSDGLSAYEVAVNDGFVGTESEWLLSLKGEPGEQGEPGVAGADGEPGEKGDQGDPGAAGAPGAGLPVGGTAGQVLRKINGTDYNTEWGDAGVQVATDLETIAGTIDDKAISPLKLKNWWTDIKTKVITFAETITFTKAPKLNSLTANYMVSLNASKEAETIIQKMTAVITNTAVHTLLTTPINWNNANVYVGAAITGEEQLKMWADSKYFYYMYDSTTPKRMSLNSIEHLIGNSGTPSIAAGAAAGTTPTISITGTDLGFRITLTVGTSPTTGTLATVTFNRPYGSAPFVSASDKNANAAALGVRPYNTTTTTTLTLSVGTALTASTQYIWDFTIAQ